MMRKLAVCYAVLALSAVAAAQAGGAAPAPSTPASVPVKVGVIHIQNAILASNEGQRDFLALQKRFEPKGTELQNMQKELEELKKQLNTQGDKLNDESRNSLAKSIEQKEKIGRRAVEDFRSEADAAQNELLNRIGGKMLAVVETYAKNNGFAVILDISNPQSGVLWAGPTASVTQEVINAYNAVSGVPAPPPPPPQAPSASKPATGAGTAAPKPAGTTPAPKPGSNPPR